jgi:N-acetylglucosamine malate deacetylase 1
VTAAVDVLALGAHPDDAEIGCGGTMLLAAGAGLRVAVADLTLGEAASTGTPEERDEERRRAADILGLAARPALGLPDGRLGGDPGHTAAVVRVIRELRPRVVLAPPLDDRHPDHAAAGRLAREAAFLAGLPRMGEGSPHRPAHVFHYLLHHPLEPSFVVDVSAVWKRKLEAVEAHRSQFGGGPAGVVDTRRFLEARWALAAVHGAMIGARWGEGFHYPGPVPLKGLPGLDPPEPGRYQIYH